MLLLGFFKKFFTDKQFREENLKIFSDWINFSLWNRAKFVYTVAFITVLVRYCLYSVHQNSWIPNSVTLYSALLSFAYASILLFAFGVLKNMNFSVYIRKFIDVDRIRENRVKFDKFKKLTAERHGAQKSLKISSKSPLLIFTTSFMLINMSFKSGFLVPVVFGSICYNIWVISHAWIFRKYMLDTPVPPDLQHIKPLWVRNLELNDKKSNIYLFNGVGSGISEGASGTGVGKRVVKNVLSFYRNSVSYVFDPKNLQVVSFVGGAVITAVGGSDYLFAEANGRTTITTRAVEAATNGTYSPDPDTRSKASVLRRKGLSLLDCCKPNSMCLDSDLIENKYEEVKPYEPLRYRSLEQQNSSLEQQVLLLQGENERLKIGKDLKESPVLE